MVTPVENAELAENGRTIRPARQVAVLIEFDDTWGRNVVESIARYAQDVDWRLLLTPRDSQRRIRVPEGWRGDGVIVGVRDQSLLDHVRGLGVPVVDVETIYSDEPWLSRVATDDHRRARMALDHFRSRQLQHYACFAPPIGRYPSKRAQAFRDLARTEGFDCVEYASCGQKDSPVDHQQLAAWLAALPSPVGVFASDPFPARQLAEACVREGLDIPGDVAVLSGDEDELLCGVMTPRISSVELASHRIGMEAAKLLQDLMDGEKSERRREVLLEPLRVCARRSTDHLAISDPDMQHLVRLIWDHAAEGVQVADLVRAATMSRRKMEQRFKEVLGRTPAEEIRRVKLEQARQLMVTTSMSVTAVAIACGFASGPYLAHAFRKHFGINPSELRVGRVENPASRSLLASAPRPIKPMNGNPRAFE